MAGIGGEGKGENRDQSCDSPNSDARQSLIRDA
jgi:hypothetical protein